MSRIASGDRIEVAPSNNIYTVLAGVAALAVLIGFIVLVMRGMALGVDFMAM
jgi:hypothetical protein